MAYDPIDHDLTGLTEKEVGKELRLYPLNELIEKLSRSSNSENNLLIVDACRTNPSKGSTSIQRDSVTRLPSGMNVLFASMPGQRSWESSDPKIPFGVMTHFLVNGLRGKAKNRLDQLTWQSLVNYILVEMSLDDGKLAGGPSRRQRPNLVGNSSGLIVLEDDFRDDRKTIVDDRSKLRRLKAIHRRAQVDILDVYQDKMSGETMTRLRFTELSEAGVKRGAGRILTVRGSIVSVDCWLVKFEDKYIEQNDFLRSRSLALFRRIYGDLQAPVDAIHLESPADPPLAYSDSKLSTFEKIIWRDLHSIANDRRRAEALGIRAAHGQAVSFKAEKGRIYQLEISAAGELVVKPGKK